MKQKTIFLVKFEGGYYADKQPHYDWSFTSDPNLAKQYGSRKTAEARAEHGKCLLNDGEPLNSTDPTHMAIGKGNVEIEEYVLKTVLEKI
jgi:hypothetical protein